MFEKKMSSYPEYGDFSQMAFPEYGDFTILMHIMCVENLLMRHNRHKAQRNITVFRKRFFNFHPESGEVSS
ncbi:MAG: hypothetical protein EAZ92_02480 [Candidatus Kapaibacterium sp.]|nr:MAG: hypothetical protein EAZ92_02480 [Candidatus Kapabacteria bacterium]